MKAGPSTKATAILDALDQSNLMTTNIGIKRRPGRPTWQETVERANAREAQRAAEAKGGRPKKEDREAAPLFIPAGSCGCLLCPWYGSPGDLFQHAEKHNQVHAEYVASLEAHHQGKEWCQQP